MLTFTTKSFATFLYSCQWLNLVKKRLQFWIKLSVYLPHIKSNILSNKRRSVLATHFTFWKFYRNSIFTNPFLIENSKLSLFSCDFKSIVLRFSFRFTLILIISHWKIFVKNTSIFLHNTICTCDATVWTNLYIYQSIWRIEIF